jgi:uncharacterized protein (UPF0276 family)
MRRMRIMSLRVPDRFGLTWHPSLAAGVLAHLDRIDIVEVIPEGRFLESRRARRALRRLARTVPVSIHGVSLGLATSAAVEPHRLEEYARLIGEVEPESWSEHLAFVRAASIELGHLAAPPRRAETVDAAAEHVELARRYIGSYPSLENVATPLEPPGSDRSEVEWLRDILATSPAHLLLDLHNLYTNGINFGFDPAMALEALPLNRIRSIHIAGGLDVRGHGGEARRIDDHRHDVPDPVYELLALVGERVSSPVDVVLERDGAFPPIHHLLEELNRARAALARGRATARLKREHTLGPLDDSSASALAGPQTGPGTDRLDDVDRYDAALLETFLAHVFTDSDLRARYLLAPFEEATRAGLTADQAHRLERVDPIGLELAAASFARKRGAATSTADNIPRWRALLRAARVPLA